METNRKLKMNISMTQEVKDYLTQKSDSMGMSASAFISMLISQSKQQEQALGSIDLLKTMMAQMKDMEVKSISNDSQLTREQFNEKYGTKEEN